MSARQEAIEAGNAAMKAKYGYEPASGRPEDAYWVHALDAIPTDVLARYVVERRLREHAERLATDPEIWAQVDEIERRLVAGGPLEDLLGPGITAEEFRRQYLPEDTS